MEQTQTHSRVFVIGAGPAGLTAAYLLAKRGVPVHVAEMDPRYVGGISKTVIYRGFHFDIGGHRFFSKSKQVEDFWSEILPHDMLDRPRSSRIFYGRRFYSYPLKAFEALFNLGILEAARCMLSYLKARLFPVRDPKSFEDWVSNQFGRRLFSIFFRTYTEKVWGMSCREISADWAAQRIKGLSLGTAILSALLPKRQPRDRGQVIKTLIDTFRYPRKGPGMMWEACAEKTRALGGRIELGQRVVSCSYDDAKRHWVIGVQPVSGGPVTQHTAEHVISSAPLRELALSLCPEVSPKARQSAEALKYRDFLTVVLITEGREFFDDNWIYIHDPSVKVGRIQNFKSWSPQMVPDPKNGCYGLEYFCFEGDGLWKMSDAALVEFAKKEMAQLGLTQGQKIVDGCVVRQTKAYPVYDEDYARHVGVLRSELESRYPGLHPVGRNGMHKYNNQDHAMMTAMLTVENILAGGPRFDIWRVNQDAEYHEAGSAGDQPGMAGSSGLREVPGRITVEDA